MMKEKRRLLWLIPAVTVLALAVYLGAMCWLHHQQLSAADSYAADLSAHLEMAQQGEVYSLTSLLILPVYTVTGTWGLAALVTAFQFAALAAFAWGIGQAVPELSGFARLLISLVVNLAQAVWIPRGGYWYLGTVNGTIYHNTTYIMLAPFALLGMIYFYRTWADMRSGLKWKTWLAYTALLTCGTAFKSSFVFAFAPALLILLIADLIRTRGRNLKREILMGCSVLPSIALCLLEAAVLFGGEDQGLQLIFTVDPAYYANHIISWGVFNEASRRGLIRSFVFVGAVTLLLGRTAWGNFRYRFSFFTFAVAMAEAMLLIEKGDRIGHANLWWGAFICYWIFFMESFCAFLRSCIRWYHGNRGLLLGGRLVLCAAALAWHIVSGCCFLVLLMQGNSYSIPIATWKLWF